MDPLPTLSSSRVHSICVYARASEGAYASMRTISHPDEGYSVFVCALHLTHREVLGNRVPCARENAVC